MADEVLVVDLRLDGRQFDRVARGVMGILRGVGNGIQSVRGLIASLGVGGALSGAGLLAFGASSIKAASDIDALKRALLAVAGSAEAAERQMARLKRLADRSPVIGLESAIRGGVQLQSSGFGENESLSIMSTISNAVARGGGTQDGFERVLVNLQQIASQGKLTGDELRETAAFIPGFRKALLDAFPNGTEGLTGLEVIRGVVAELAKLPEVGGGVASVFANFGSSGKMAMAAFGDSLNKLVLPVIEKVTSALDYLTSSGILTSLGDSLVSAFDADKIINGLIKGLAYTIALIKQLPTVAQNISRMVTNAFARISESLGTVSAILGALFLSSTIARIVGAIGAITRATIGLVAAVRSLGIAQAIVSSLQGGLLGVGKTLAIMVLAAAAGTYIFDRVTASLSGLGEVAATGLGLGDINRNAQSEYSKIMDFINGGKPGEGDPGTDPSTKAVNSQTPVLKSIDSTLKDLRSDIRDVLLGGGAATAAKFNARNISGWSSSGGGGTGWAKVRQGFDEMIADHVASLGVSGVFKSQGR